MSYTPQPGSLPYRVIAHLRANPKAQLTISQIAIEFDVQARSGIQATLIPTVAAGVLTYGFTTQSDRAKVYTAGPALFDSSTAALSAAIAPRRPAAPRGGSRKILPPIDVASLVVRTDLPMPSVAVRAKGHTRYDQAFDLLDRPGACTLFSRIYMAALQKALITYCKRTRRVLKVRAFDAEQCGVWREA